MEVDAYAWPRNAEPSGREGAVLREAFASWNVAEIDGRTAYTKPARGWTAKTVEGRNAAAAGHWPDALDHAQEAQRGNWCHPRLEYWACGVLESASNLFRIQHGRFSWPVRGALMATDAHPCFEIEKAGLVG